MNRLTLDILKEINRSGLPSFTTHNSVCKLIVFALDDGPRTSQELADIIGFAVSTIRINLRVLKQVHFVLKEHNKYSLNSIAEHYFE